MELDRPDQTTEILRPQHNFTLQFEELTLSEDGDLPFLLVVAQFDLCDGTKVTPPDSREGAESHHYCPGLLRATKARQRVVLWAWDERGFKDSTFVRLHGR